MKESTMQKMRRILRSIIHIHDWGNWQDIKLELHDELSGESYTVDGQKKYCKLCGKKRVREV